MDTKHSDKSKRDFHSFLMASRIFSFSRWWWWWWWLCTISINATDSPSCSVSKAVWASSKINCRGARGCNLGRLKDREALCSSHTGAARGIVLVLSTGPPNDEDGGIMCLWCTTSKRENWKMNDVHNRPVATSVDPHFFALFQVSDPASNRSIQFRLNSKDFQREASVLKTQ